MINPLTIRKNRTRPSAKVIEAFRKWELLQKHLDKIYGVWSSIDKSVDSEEKVELILDLFNKLKFTHWDNREEIMRSCANFVKGYLFSFFPNEEILKTLKLDDFFLDYFLAVRTIWDSGYVPVILSDTCYLYCCENVREVYVAETNFWGNLKNEKLRHSAMNNKKLNNIDEILELEEDEMVYIIWKKDPSCGTPLHYMGGRYSKKDMNSSVSNMLKTLVQCRSFRYEKDYIDGIYLIQKNKKELR